MKKILVFGGTGFIGTELIRKLKDQGDYLMLVTRTRKLDSIAYYGVDEIIEYQEGMKSLDSQYFRNLDVIINLAGESILGLRWTKKKRKRIFNSRENIIRLIKDSLEGSNLKIPLLIQASAVGFYGYSENDIIVNEDSLGGNGFLAEVCKKLENEVASINEYFDRVAILRFGNVLGEKGFVKQISRGFIFNLSFSFGKGQQWFSWIHIEDVINGIEFIIEKENLKGPINFAVNESIRFSELIKTLGNIKNNKILIIIPLKISQLVLGDMSDIINKGIKVEPRKLIENGYEYKFTNIECALKNILLK